MSAIAHWLEEAGISTVVIGLIKLHLEKTKPPRALWVPFELGRPLGAPSNPELQQEVLQQALQLVETADKPVIEDFETDDPRFKTDSKWHPPELTDHDSVASECTELKPYYQRQCVDKSRTSVGVAKVPITELAELFDEVYATETFKDIREDISARLMFRLAIDDLKAYYIESALADRSSPSSEQLNNWIWNDTLLGKQMRELRHRFMASEDEKICDLGTKFIVPHAWRD